MAEELAAARNSLPRLAKHSEDCIRLCNSHLEALKMLQQLDPQGKYQRSGDIGQVRDYAQQCSAQITRYAANQLALDDLEEEIYRRDAVSAKKQRKGDKEPLQTFFDTALSKRVAASSDCKLHHLYKHTEQLIAEIGDSNNTVNCSLSSVAILEPERELTPSSQSSDSASFRGALLVEERLGSRDPVTQEEIRDPVRNKQCGHIYDRKGITKYVEEQLRNGKRKIKCPMIGCLGSKLKLSQLEDYSLGKKQKKEAINTS